MKLAEKAQCTGCGACLKSCPRGAITFHDDENGFPTPRVDSAKCVDCGLCERACPALDPPEPHPIREAYAAQITDGDALKLSTSGGVFTAFAREIFRRGGTVYGCVWDEAYNAVIRRAEKEEDIAPMRGSKYVWSWAGDVFPEVRGDLETGRPVLFTGLPCQVAGLRKYLGKDHPNLYLMDFLCSGSPSPLAFQRWLSTIRGRTGLPELNLKFRDKKDYGVGVHITYKGQKRKSRATGEHISNPYYYAFYIRLLNRESCYRCPYGTAQRMSDVTFCDYWGVGRYHRELNIPAGISGLLVNTEKGGALLADIPAEIRLVKTEAAHIAAANNLSLGEPRQIPRPPFKDRFFDVLREKGWNAAKRRYLYDWVRLRRLLAARYPRQMRGIGRLIGRK